MERRSRETCWLSWDPQVGAYLRGRLFSVRYSGSSWQVGDEPLLLALSTLYLATSQPQPELPTFSGHVLTHCRCPLSATLCHDGTGAGKSTLLDILSMRKGVGQVCRCGVACVLP